MHNCIPPGTQDVCFIAQSLKYSSVWVDPCLKNSHIVPLPTPICSSLNTSLHLLLIMCCCSNMSLKVKNILEEQHMNEPVFTMLFAIL